MSNERYKEYIMTAIITYKTKRSTDEIISGAIDRQQSWRENRRSFTRDFLRKINVFARDKESENATAPQSSEKSNKNDNESVLRAYWFPILCALIVIAIAVFVMFFRNNAPVKVIVPNVPEPIIKPIDSAKKDIAATSKPTFDIVRIEKSGQIVVAGRSVGESNVSIVVNDTVVATERTNKNGEFVYAPNNALKPGNYTIYLIDADKNEKSIDSVFVYVPENYKNAVSLLVNKTGSTLLQSPQSENGILNVSKIDYLENGRMVVTGRALPRLRVSVTLNNKYLGFARVSNHKTYGLGVNVGELVPGEKYTLIVRLHDSNGTTIATKKHEFVLPADENYTDTFYTVRRGDSLWVVARNFYGRGVLFSLIADYNKIKNPNLIYPHQVLQIPAE